MKIRTFFCEEKQNNKFILSGTEFNHFNVMRLKQGDKIKIICNSSFEYECVAEQVLKKQVICKILSESENFLNPTKNLTAFVCLLKQDKNELVAEKLTELGASKIVFVNSKFVSREGALNVGRVNKIIVSAAKQCGRSTLPKIEACNLKDINPKDFNNFFVFYEEENSSMGSDKIEGCSNAFLIGSEGGLDKEEIMLLKNKGAKILSLGRRILRAETAVITAASIILNKTGEI